MTKTLVSINQKGGVGKTTLVANCGAYWAQSGRRVLLLDLDPQAHLSLHLGTEQEERNLYRVFRGDMSMKASIVTVESEGLDLIPAHIDLSAAEYEFGQEVGREVILRDHLRGLLSEVPYDLVLIDSPPSLGFLSINALTAVDNVVIPVQAEFFALHGMAQLIRVVGLVRDRLQPKLNWSAVVPTLVDSRTNLAKEVIAELHKHCPGKVTTALLSKRIKVAEAPSFGKSIFRYAPHSEGAQEFAALARELEERLKIPPVEVSDVSEVPQRARAEAPPVSTEAKMMTTEAETTPSVSETTADPS